VTGSELAAWQEHNRHFLALAVDDLAARTGGGETAAIREQLAATLDEMGRPPALLQLFEAFELGAFEQDVVLLCTATELDPRFASESRLVTVAQALESLPDAHWAALDAAAPLRGWGIVEFARATALPDSTLHLADDVLRFLMGFDPRAGADAVFRAVAPPPAITASQLALGEHLAEAIATTLRVAGEPPAIELHGATEEDRLAIAGACAELLEGALASAELVDLPAPGAELDALLLAWSRLGRMTSTLLCLTGAGAAEDPTVAHRLARALARVREPLFVSVQRPLTIEPVRPIVRREVVALSADERLEVWQVSVDAMRGRLRSRRTRGLVDALEALAGDFRLGSRTIQRVCLETEALLRARDGAGSADPLLIAALLREGCARTIRAHLDPLAERITLESVAEVVLPETEALLLLELEASIRLSNQVDARWGLGRGRGRGTTALFAGASGTGKTHAAMALARRLGLDLYRVDLAGVLSKYIGETEKNLDRIFEAAEVGGVILLFDEADALFGKRSEVRDSHDRYANLGTAFLLARMESAPTPTILTTNLKEALDPAFIRRLHFVIEFPFPAQEQREEIWRTIYPPAAPVEELDPRRLAAVAASGGTISNIARRSAFLAASEPAAIEMRHLLLGTARELRKLGRDMTPEELEAWERSRSS
jgi:ATPase family associated with various cellular activities (AAA)/Winged helix domain, variant